MRQHAGKSRPAARRLTLCHQLMHARAQDAAAQRAIDPVMPGRHMPRSLARGTATAFDQRDAPLNQGERIDTHMFFICSILKAVYAVSPDLVAQANNVA